MAEVVETLIVEIEGDLTDLRKDFKKSGDVVEKGSKKMASSAKTASSAFAGMGKAALKVAATISVVGLAFKSLRDIFLQFGAIDVLAKTADSLGITTEALVGLQFAAGQTGIDNEFLVASLRKMSISLAEVAITGAGPAKKAFDALGLSANELLKLPIEKQFGIIGDKLNEISSIAERAGIGKGIFGEEISRLLNTLRIGTEGVEAFRKETVDLGIAISRVDAAKIEAANDTFDRLSQSFVGAAQRAAISLAPALELVASEFVEMNKEGEKSTTIMDKVGEAIVVAFTIGKQVVARFRVVLNAAVFGFSKLGEFATIGADFAVRAFSRLKAGIAGIGLVSVDIANVVVKAFQQVSQFAGKVFDLIKAGADVAGSAIVLVFENAAIGIQAIVRGIKIVFAEALEVAAIAAAAAAGFVGADSTISEGISNKAQALKLSLLRSAGASTAALDGAKEGLNKSVEAFKVSGLALLTVSEAVGSETLNQLSKDFQAIAIQQLKASEGGDELTKKLGKNLELIQEFTAEARKGLDVSLEDLEGAETVDKALARFAELKKVSEEAFQEQVAKRLDRTQILADIDARALANKLQREMESNEKLAVEAATAAEAEKRLKEQRNAIILAAGQQFLSDLSTLTQSENRKAFEVGKAAAIAQAGVSAILGAQQAFTSLSLIPFVGPALGTAAAAAALAAGAINIQKIRSIQFGGGGASTGGGGGATPAISAGAGAGSAAGGGGGQGGPIQTQQFNITLQGERFSGAQIRELIEGINDQLGDNATLQVG